MYNNIATLLTNIIAIDQELRKNKIFGASLMRKFDCVSTDIIKALVDKFGLPAPENVGAKAAKYFIVLLIHTTDMKYVSKLSKSPEFKKVDYDKTDLAILEDRILLFEGKKQCFGTVIETKKDKNGNLVTKPRPTKDEKNVDKRRKEYGLSPLADYLKSSEEIFKRFLQDKPEK